MPVLQAGPDAEWLCTNAGGSFAMGTIDRRPRRKYHSLLTVREPGIGESLNIVAELEEWFEVGGEKFALHSYDWGNAVAKPSRFTATTGETQWSQTEFSTWWSSIRNRGGPTISPASK